MGDAPTMAVDEQPLKEQPLDVLIIGGGPAGATAALRAAPVCAPSCWTRGLTAGAAAWPATAPTTGRARRANRRELVAIIAARRRRWGRASSRRSLETVLTAPVKSAPAAACTALVS